MTDVTPTFIGPCAGEKRSYVITPGAWHNQAWTDADRQKHGGHLEPLIEELPSVVQCTVRISKSLVIRFSDKASPEEIAGAVANIMGILSVNGAHSPNTPVGIRHRPQL